MSNHNIDDNFSWRRRARPESTEATAQRTRNERLQRCYPGTRSPQFATAETIALGRQVEATLELRGARPSEFSEFDPAWLQLLVEGYLGPDEIPHEAIAALASAFRLSDGDRSELSGWRGWSSPQQLRTAWLARELESRLETAEQRKRARDWVGAGACYRLAGSAASELGRHLESVKANVEAVRCYGRIHGDLDAATALKAATESLERVPAGTLGRLEAETDVLGLGCSRAIADKVGIVVPVELNPQQAARTMRDQGVPEHVMARIGSEFSVSNKNRIPVAGVVKKLHGSVQRFVAFFALSPDFVYGTQPAFARRELGLHSDAELSGRPNADVSVLTESVKCQVPAADGMPRELQLTLDVRTNGKLVVSVREATGEPVRNLPVNVISNRRSVGKPKATDDSGTAVFSLQELPPGDPRLELLVG